MTFLLVAAVAADITPTRVRQGSVVRISAASEAVSARMKGRTIPLFPQPGGRRFGLMPVGANDAPGSYTVEVFAEGDRLLHSSPVTVIDGNFPEQNVRLTRAVQTLKPSPGEMETVAALRNTVTAVRHWEEPFRPPLPTCMTSRYGVRRLHNGKRTGNYHSGVDQRSPADRPITTIAAGVVRIAKMFNIHGGTVGVDHGQGVTSTYLHMSKFAVAEGAEVRAGDLLGYVGSTGRSTGPHLHWTLNVNGVPVNPLDWVSIRSCSAPAKRLPRRRR